MSRHLGWSVRGRFPANHRHRAELALARSVAQHHSVPQGPSGSSAAYAKEGHHPLPDGWPSVVLCSDCALRISSRAT